MTSLPRQNSATRMTALALATGLLVTGCTDLASSTIAGTLVGAGAGAIIGHQRDKLVEGAIIGAIVGGSIGYVVGRTQTTQVATARQTNRAQQYRAVSGLEARQTEVSVTPKAVNPGDDVDMSATLALMAPENDEQIKVRHRVGIYKGEQLVGSILEDNFTLQPGTHRISRRITLQEDFPKGQYTYVSHIKVMTDNDVAEATSETKFTVS